MISERTDYMRIAPNLDVLVKWSSQMNEALHEHYASVMLRQLHSSEQLRKSYARWCRAHNAAFDQIRRFYTLTNSLPVAGDRLCFAYSEGSEELNIEQRELFSTADSSSMLIVYHVRAAHMTDLAGS